MINYQFPRLLILICFPFLYSACSTTYKLSDGTVIKEKEIISEIETFQTRDKALSNYRSPLVNIVELSKEMTEVNSKDLVIDDLKLGTLRKATNSGKLIKFYYKTGYTFKKYYQPDMINVFQSNHINNNLFGEEVDRIINLLENGVITMAEIESNLNKEYGIKVQYFPPSSFAEASVFIPNVIELLKDKMLLRVYKTEKVDLDHVSYLSLIQNIGHVKEIGYVQYLSITLK